MIIISILILLISLNIFINVSLKFNILNNIGSIKIKVFKITIASFDISLTSEYFQFTKKNKKVVEIQIKLSDPDLEFIKEINSTLLKKIYVQRILFLFYIDLEKYDVTALLNGIIYNVLNIVFCNIKAKNIDTNIRYETISIFNDSKIELNFNVNFIVTIFDFLSSIINAIHKRRIKLYEKRNI